MNITSSSVPEFISDVSANKYEVLYNNINNYSNENNIFCVYVASYKFLNLSSFETALQNFVADGNVKNFVYVNADKLDKIDNLRRLLSDFGYDGIYDLIGNLPVFIIFKDGIIVDIIEVYDKDTSFLNKLMEDIYD